jgi:hypothetical protein
VELYLLQGHTPQYLNETVSVPFPPVNGYVPLRSLFLETSTLEDKVVWIRDDAGPRPIFTLKTYDHTIPEESVFYRHQGPNLLKSIYLLYLEYSDPSEYSFALGAFGSWEHWRQLRESIFFQDTYKLMKDALEAKIKSAAIKAACGVAQSSGPQALQAAKWLHSLGEGKKRGRPSKEELAKELKREAEEAKLLEEDTKRLGIN